MNNLMKNIGLSIINNAVNLFKSCIDFVLVVFIYLLAKIILSALAISFIPSHLFVVALAICIFWEINEIRRNGK